MPTMHPQDYHHDDVRSRLDVDLDRMRPERS